jgi:DNA-binding response OmpR family regulator
MEFAMCAEFLEADVWEGRLRDAAAPCAVEITECNSVRSLLPVLELKPFSLLIVMLNGVAGLDAVRKIRARQPETPLLWVSDEDFSLLGYQYHVTCFLHGPVCDAELREAVKNCLCFREERRKK